MKAIFYPEPFEAMHIPEQLKEMWIDRLYDQFLIGREDMTIYDIGANIGLFSMLVAPYAKKIYAVEPQKDNFESLVKNLDFNGWSKVQPINKAVTNSGEKVKLYLSPNQTAHNIITPMTQEGKFEEIDSITIEELIKEPADLVKLDVEGAEFEILCGKHFKAVAPNIKVIIGEMHDWANRNFFQIKWALQENGFRVKMFDYGAHFFLGEKV